MDHPDIVVQLPKWIDRFAREELPECKEGRLWEADHEVGMCRRDPMVNQRRSFDVSQRVPEGDYACTAQVQYVRFRGHVLRTEPWCLVLELSVCRLLV